ncbi:MAG: hypothetical protein NUV61_04555, partial [Candidatus Azambacteria bacterium]|nr:hypothetical protein [Candidatus Azambacteria bacterium]
TYNNVFLAAMAFCGACPPSMNKNPATSIISTASGGSIVWEKKMITAHMIAENDVAPVGEENVVSLETPVPVGIPI